MRVTDLTKKNTILRNIEMNSEKLQELQTNLSTGRRISKLSDDPIAVTQVQDFRTRISFIDTLKQNVQQNFIWMDRTESELAQMGDLLRRAKTLILAQSNASADEGSRRVAAEELQAIIQGLMTSANARVGKLHVFSGSKTFTRPLELAQPVQSATIRLGEEEGLTQQIMFEGNSANSYQIRITKPGDVGRAHYVVSDDGGQTWSREKTLLPRIELIVEKGKPSDKVFMRIAEQAIQQPEQPRVFPVGLVIAYLPNPPVKFMGNTELRMVQTGEGVMLPVNITAGEILFRQEENPESVDVFNLLYGLKRSLLDNDQGALEERLDSLDAAFDRVLQGRARVGSVRKEMEDRLVKLNDREFAKIRQMSDLEDLDFAKAAVDVNVTDARHKAALNTSGRLIQPSLLDFLR